MSNMVLLRTVMGPVTPAIHKGCAPNMENTKEAMNEDRRTSETPYCCVVSIKSRENAIPGSTLRAVRADRIGESRRDTYFAKKIKTIAGITL